MYKEYKENKYILRKYIRNLTVAKATKDKPIADIEQAIKFFMILHNLLEVEDAYYDQCMMKGKEINKYLHLVHTFRVTDIMGSFYTLFNRGGRVRSNMETLTEIEEIKILLNKNLKYYTKLIL